MRLYRLAESIDNLFGSIGFHLLQHLLQAVVAILLLCQVFCLVQSVSLDKKHFAPDAVYLFTYIVELRPQTDGGIRLYIDELAIEQWWIMSGVTVV